MVLCRRVGHRFCCRPHQQHLVDGGQGGLLNYFLDWFSFSSMRRQPKAAGQQRVWPAVVVVGHQNDNGRMSMGGEASSISQTHPNLGCCLPIADKGLQKLENDPIYRAITSPTIVIKRQIPLKVNANSRHIGPKNNHSSSWRCQFCNAEWPNANQKIFNKIKSNLHIFSSSKPSNSAKITASKMPAFNCEFDQNNQHVPPNSPNPSIQMPRQLNDRTFVQHLLNDIDTFIFDADGVLWLGEQAIAGSSDFIDFLAKKGKHIIVLTNNATKSRAVYAKKLAQLGYGRCINEHNIVNPAAVVADLIDQSGLAKDGKKVYMIGGQGIKDELALRGIDYFGHGFDPVDGQPASKGSAFLYAIELEEEPENVGAVVVGYEKYFNYLKLMKSANYLRNEQCLFLATNEDETCPGPNPDTIIPDAGPLVAAVKTASGREPLVVGKPNTPAFDYICRRWKINPRRTLMTGDRLNTDVKFGKDHGLRTLLVLSGCHSVDDIVESQMQGRADLVPDFYADCLGALVDQPATEEMTIQIPIPCKASEAKALKEKNGIVEKSVPRKAVCVKN